MSNKKKKNTESIKSHSKPLQKDTKDIKNVKSKSEKNLKKVSSEQKKFKSKQIKSDQTGNTIKKSYFDTRSTKNVKVYETFESMKLDKNLLKGIRDYNFSKPSSIQKKAIMPIIDDEDVIIQAKSGSGKTATYCIGILQLLSQSTSKPPKTEALVLVPTRELAIQISAVFDGLSSSMNIKGTICVGGTNTDETEIMKHSLKHGQHVVVGTPGKVNEMIKKDLLKVDDLKMLVIDEADQMLSPEFKEQLDNIKYACPPVQTLIVSATLPDECLIIAEMYLTEPIKILVNENALAVDSMIHYYISVQNQDDKYKALMRIFSSFMVNQTIIFVNTRNGSERLAQRMKKDGIEVSYLHGILRQEEREKIMQNFRQCKITALICTNLIARGIDVQTCNFVINYDMAINQSNRKTLNKEVYLHRVGRCARYERRGIAVSLALEVQMEGFKSMSRKLGFKLNPVPKNIEELEEYLNGFSDL